MARLDTTAKEELGACVWYHERGYSTKLTALSRQTRAPRGNCIHRYLTVVDSLSIDPMSNWPGACLEHQDLCATTFA